MKNLIEIQKQIAAIYNNDMQGNRKLAGISILYSNDTIGLSISGSHEEIYTALAQFLFQQPEYLEVFALAVECASDYHNQNNTEFNGIVGEA